MASGAYEKEGGPTDFNLRPKDIADPIPEDQMALHANIYATRNILKLLEQEGMFAKDPDSLVKFMERLLQVADTGLLADNVKMNEATKAIDQIREDVIRRKGRPIKYRYLCILALWALGGIAVGGIVTIASYYLGATAGYGWVIIGSMVGAWISLAATRRQLALEDVQNFLDYRFEPFIRMMFVGLIASVLALFLQLNILSLSIGFVDFSTFDSQVGMALALGLVAGISERAVSVQIIERARKVFGEEPT